MALLVAFFCRKDGPTFRPQGTDLRSSVSQSGWGALWVDHGASESLITFWTVAPDGQ
jgi:hypothetical protein